MTTFVGVTSFDAGQGSVRSSCHDKRTLHTVSVIENMRSLVLSLLLSWANTVNDLPPRQKEPNILPLLLPISYSPRVPLTESTELPSGATLSTMSIHSPTSHYFPKVYQKENQIPTPSHRHAAPSAPWPWINIHDGELQDACVSHCCA